MIELFFFGKPIKTLGSLGKIRVGRVTGNTHIFFFGLIVLGILTLTIPLSIIYGSFLKFQSF